MGRQLSIGELFAVVLVTASVLLLSVSDWGYRFESETIRRLEFSLRAQFGLAPSLPEDMFVLAYDDPTLFGQQQRELTLSDWGLLLSALRQTSPEFIAIDKVFRMIPRGQSEKELIKNLRPGAPVVVGAYLAKQVSSNLSELPFRPEHDPGLLSGNRGQHNSSGFADSNALPTAFLYGPHPSLLPFFSRIGHINHHGSGLVTPVQEYPGRLIPHAALLTAQKLRIRANQIEVNGSRLHLDRRGSLVANISTRTKLYERTFSLEPIMKKVRAGRSLSKAFPAGSAIVVLPEMYTGGSDWKDTPAGRVQGGHVLASMIASARSGNWIAFWDGWVWPMASLLGCALAILLLSTMSAWWQATAAVFGFVAICASGIALFCMNQVTPWSWLALSFCGSMVAVNFARARNAERYGHLIESRFSGLVPASVLKRLKRDRDFLSRRPQDIEVAVMFVDIAGFSRLARTREPSAAFNLLRVCLDRITLVVHAYGGVVDRSLGDGLFCYFTADDAFSYSGASSSGGSTSCTQRAIDCAIAIQQANIVAASHRDGAAFPLRVGVNTCNAILGNIGDEARVDFTLVGDGINRAKRLEDACEPNRVLVGEGSTMQLRQDISLPMLQRSFAAKNEATLTHAVEIDPMNDEAGLLKQAREHFQAVLGQFRATERVLVPEWLVTQVWTDYGAAELIDVSEGGLALRLPKYLSRGVEISVELPRKIGDRELTDSEQRMTVLVRWGRPHGDQYLHGCLVARRQDENKNWLVDLIRAASRQKAS